MKLSKTSTRKSQDSQLQQQLLVALMHHTENLKQIYNDKNTQTFYGYGISSEQYEFEISGTLKIPIQETNSKIFLVS